MDTTVILVDEKDNFLGYEKKEVCHTGGGKRHRAITIFLFNKEGKILLQRRKHKRWDNVWDTAGATDVRHLEHGDESYEDSGERCMKTEWNISVPLRRLFGFNYFEKYGTMCENEYCMILIGEAPDNINYNPDVAYGQRWIGVKELAEEIGKNPDEYTPWAIIAVKEFLKHPASRKFL